MVRVLLKQLSKLFSRGRRDLFSATQAAKAPFRGFFQDGYLLGTRAVFPLGVVHRLDIDPA